MPVDGATGPEKVADPKFRKVLAVTVESATALPLNEKSNSRIMSREGKAYDAILND
jgi:hypothetical protein